jgi:hypothetical protein
MLMFYQRPAVVQMSTGPCPELGGGDVDQKVEVRKLDQNRATSSTDRGTMVRLGSLTRKRVTAGRGLPRPMGAPPVACLKPWSHLTGSAREGGPQGAIRDGNALVDGGACEVGLLGGLESHVFQQGGLGDQD